MGKASVPRLKSLRPFIGRTERRLLAELGVAVRARRQSLDIEMQIVAEAARVSMPDLRRIECGVPSVSMGTYMQVFVALGMHNPGRPPPQPNWPPPAIETAARERGLPAMVKVAEFPCLRELCWHVKSDAELTPVEALSTYERNWRHLSNRDPASWSFDEQVLLAELVRVHGNGHLLV